MGTHISRQNDPLHQVSAFLVHYLENAGVSERALRQELALAGGWLDNIDHNDLIALAPRLLEAAGKLSKDPLICLHAGERFHFCLAGAGGLAATHAPTTAMALETFGRFVRSDDLLAIRRTNEEDTVYLLQLDVIAPWPQSAKEHIVDGVFAGLIAALRSTCLPSFQPVEVNLTRGAPANPQSHTRALGNNTTFGCQRNELVMLASDLSQANPLYSPLLYEQLQFIADLNSGDATGKSPLRQLVEQAVRTGSHSLDDVASTLRMSPRTLQRRLQTEGAAFRSVLSETRVAIAVELLADNGLTIAEIARRLHYRDDKTFRKAVKTVTGKTPSELRST